MRDLISSCSGLFQFPREKLGMGLDQTTCDIAIEIRLHHDKSVLHSSSYKKRSCCLSWTNSAMAVKVTIQLSSSASFGEWKVKLLRKMYTLFAFPVLSCLSLCV